MSLLLTPKPTPRDAPRTLRTRLVAWAKGPTLVRDLSAVLAIKLVLLMALKYAFFNHPQADHMQLPPAVVAARLLGPTTPDSPKGDHHDQ
ncbi:cytochrome oxidase putative small subunit CydP [Burkholderia sp. 22PA0106]|uniref:cytochrome oxidase putative small subunit CydP n=1 Tax=Burkholderia sp. 22PA0106 TaxID=3237371 RepID=UPI0039C13B37